MKSYISIGKRKIGADYPCFIIAEAGSNHDGNFSQAKKLIDAAADAKADAIKFQLFKAEELVTKKDWGYPILKPLEMPREWIINLIAYAHKKGLVFLATPFDNEAVDILVKAGVPAIKNASPEIRDIPLLRHIAKQKKPVILSTGVSDLADVQHAIVELQTHGCREIILLQCTSKYPCPSEMVNLRMMTTLQQAFHVPVGLSDHTMDTVTAAAAVAIGAVVIEKHLTLDRKLKGPDHPVALEPHEFKQLVENVRIIEKAMGSSIKVPVEGDLIISWHKKGIVAAVDIPADAIITRKMIKVKRKVNKIPAHNFDIVIGRKAKQHIPADTILTWEML